MKNYKLIIGIAAVAIVGACTSAPPPARIYAEPVFDKFGNPSCRPGDVPVGGVYTAGLPRCPVIGDPTIAANIDYNGDGVVDANDVPPDDPSAGDQNRSRNQGRNRNQNQSGT